MILGADILTIAKAKSYQLALLKLLKANPEMDIREKNIRLFYLREERKKAQKTFENMLKPKKETDIKIDYLPVILPVLIKKYWLHAAIAAAFLMAIGKNV
jgi:hypothetical protein